ncbi:hypothetical protein ACQCVB_17430 [Fictibacillus phosphorivorans]
MIHRLYEIIFTIAVLFTLVISLWIYAPVESAPIYLLTEEK